MAAPPAVIQPNWIHLERIFAHALSGTSQFTSCREFVRVVGRILPCVLREAFYSGSLEGSRKCERSGGQSIVLCKWQTIEVAVLVRKLCLEREKCAFCATVWCDPHSLPSLHVYIFAGAICEFPKHSVNFARVGEAAKARKLLAERAICQRGRAARKRHEHGQQRRPGLRCREDYLEARSQGEYGARAPSCPRAACLVTLQGALQLRETCENQRNLHCLEFCLFLVGCRLRAKSVGRRYDISCAHGGGCVCVWISNSNGLWYNCITRKYFDLGLIESVYWHRLIRRYE